MCKTTTLTVRLFIIWPTLQFNLSVEQHFVNEKFNFRFILQKQNIFQVVKYSCINLKIFLSLSVVFGYVQVGIFFLVFSLHTHHFQGETIKSRKRFDHVRRGRKEIQMNLSFPLNSLPQH
jgi:hypothetical protein